MPLNPLRVFLGLAPKELPKAVLIELPLDAGIPYKFDLADFGEQNEFTTCQAVYIDNADNGGIFTLTPGGGMPPVKCPSNSCGMFPIAALSKLDFEASHAITVARMRFWLLNVPQPYFVYPVL